MLKLQFLGHLMQRTDSFEKTLMPLYWNKSVTLSYSVPGLSPGELRDDRLLSMPWTFQSDANTTTVKALLQDLNTSHVLHVYFITQSLLSHFKSLKRQTSHRGHIDRVFQAQRRDQCLGPESEPGLLLTHPNRVHSANWLSGLFSQPSNMNDDPCPDLSGLCKGQSSDKGTAAL